MITIIAMMPAGPVVTHHDASVYDGAAYVFAIGLDLTAFIVERGEHEVKVVRVERCGDTCLAVDASGYHVIHLHDKLRPDESLYTFTTRTLAIERLVAVLDEDHPAPVDVPRFSTLHV